MEASTTEQLAAQQLSVSGWKRHDQHFWSKPGHVRIGKQGEELGELHTTAEAIAAQVGEETLIAAGWEFVDGEWVQHEQAARADSATLAGVVQFALERRVTAAV